jgi:hypothetical protein
MYLRMMMAIVMSLACVLATRAAEYDPLSAGPSFEAEMVEWTVRDAARDRDIPLKIYLPASRAAEPVVLFSHGLGGSRDGCSYLGQHWASRGYVAVFLQHPGSDDSVWKDQPLIRGDRFEFEDGTPVKFWGVNPLKVDQKVDEQYLADSAAMLQRLGVNLVRFHAFGKPNVPKKWAHMLKIQRVDDGLEFDPDHIALFDYGFAKMKEHGIYHG